MANLFKTVHHVCIVVHDLDRTVDYYEQLGVGPWYDYPKSSPYIELDVPNATATKEMRYRCVDLENIQLQLCEPSEADSPQRRFLDQYGEGVYHLGFEVEDQTAAEAEARALGLKIISRGLRGDGSGFCYFDTRDEAGITLEVRRSAPVAVPAG